MGSSSRAIMILAIVAVLAVDALAQSPARSHGRYKCRSPLKSQCKKCSFDAANELVCDKCIDSHAIVNDLKTGCVCDVDNGYGTLSTQLCSLWKAGLRSRRRIKCPSSKACVKCEKYGYDAELVDVGGVETGECVVNMSVTNARRLFSTDEAVWA